MFNSFYYDWTLAEGAKMLPSHIVVECQNWRCSNYHKNPAKMPFLTGVGMRLVQIKHTYLSLTDFIMTELLLKQPKMLPSHIIVECQNFEVLQPPHNFFKKSLPDLCRNKFGSNKTYLSMFNSLLLWLNSGWCSQKCCPAALLLSAKLWRCTNHLKMPANMLSLTGVEMFGLSKIYLSMFNSFYYVLTMAEAAKNDAQPHCCWVP